MLRIAPWIAAALVAASLAVAAEIPKGAHVLLQLENTINTRTAAEGDQVYLRTASPIAAEGRMLVPVGAYVQGVVAQTRRGGRVRGRAEIAIRLETMTLASGQDAARVAILAGTGASLGAAVGAINGGPGRGAGIGAGAGAAVGLATVMLTRGKDVELRRGATLDVVFDRPVSIE